MAVSCWFLICVFLLTTESTIGCHNGWVEYGNSCYLIGTDPLSWYEASYLCHSHHASLANIEDEKENVFLKAKAKETKPIGSYWLGAMDDVVEGDWKWISPEGEISLNYTDWYPGDPNNLGNNEDCMLMYYPLQWKWVDIGCKTKQHFICERRTPWIQITSPVGR